MRHTSTPRGFTLIELLVVIAIIGILSAVVLASLNTARVKGSDASVKSNLTNTRTQAELFYDANGNSYLNICTNITVNNVKSIYNQVDAAADAAGLTTFQRNVAGSGTVAACNDVATAWAAQVPLKTVTGQFFCVDSTGFATTTGATKLASGTDYLCSS
jgi:type IV pilus assembly protein PilA